MTSTSSSESSRRVAAASPPSAGARENLEQKPLRVAAAREKHLAPPLLPAAAGDVRGGAEQRDEPLRVAACK